MNLGTLTTLTAQFAGDAGQNRYTGLYTQALNIAQRQFVLDSKCLWKDDGIAVAGGTAAYSLPSDFMFEKLPVMYSKTGGNSNVELTPISRLELGRNRGDDWTTITGDPQNFIIDPEEARKQITLFPYPPAGDAGGTLTLTYYPLPADMAAAGDVPFNSYALLAQFHTGLAAWAAWMLLGAETATPEITQKRRDLLQVYNDFVTQAVNTFQNTSSEPIRMRGVRTYA